MLIVTVKDVLEGDWEKLDSTNEPFCIYVIRDGEAVLYVGLSHDPFNRLLSHFGESWRGSSAAIGPFYTEHQEKAQGWSIDLYTLEDCDPIIAKHFPRVRNGDSEVAERALIRHFRPCLNIRNNPDPSPLPEKYIRPKPTKSIFSLDANAVDYIKL